MIDGDEAVYDDADDLTIDDGDGDEGGDADGDGGGDDAGDDDGLVIAVSAMQMMVSDCVIDADHDYADDDG